MSRKPRRYVGAATYHISAQGYKGQILFKERQDYHFFTFLMYFLIEEYNVAMYHYCLMPGQTHLLVHFHDQLAFQKFPQRLHLKYAKYFARKYKHAGTVFHDRYKSFLIKNHQYLLECGRYIERNPVEADLAQTPEAYHWSSARFYLKGEKYEWLTPNPLYLGLAATPEERQKLYHNLISVSHPYEEAIKKVIYGTSRLK